MQKIIRAGVIVLLLLSFFNVSIQAASDYNPWKLHKESSQKVVQSMQAYFYDKSIKSEKEWERIREENLKDLEVLLDKERVQVRSEVRGYGKGLEAQLNHLLEKQSAKKVYAAYEIEKGVQIQVEIEKEIAAYLNDLLAQK